MSGVIVLMFLRTQENSPRTWSYHHHASPSVDLVAEQQHNVHGDKTHLTVVLMCIHGSWFVLKPISFQPQPQSILVIFQTLTKFLHLRLKQTSFYVVHRRMYQLNTILTTNRKLSDPGLVEKYCETFSVFKVPVHVCIILTQYCSLFLLNMFNHSAPLKELPKMHWQASFAMILIWTFSKEMTLLIQNSSWFTVIWTLYHMNL